MIGWVKALKSINIKVGVHAIMRGNTEDYSELQPKLFALSSISKVIIKIFGEGGVNMYRGFPNPILYLNALRKEKPDVIIVRGLKRWFPIMAAVYGRLLGVKIIIYSQETLYTNYTKKRMFQVEFINALFNSVWITPVLGKVNVKASIPKDSFFIPFVVTTEGRRTALIPSNNITRILSIGKFTERKNHLLLLEVLLKIKQEGHQFVLTIIGELSGDDHNQYYQQVLEFLTSNNMQDDVILKTNVSHTSIEAFYQDADLFVLPARNEPASIAVLEAIAHGLPVICSTTCGTQWYIDHLQTGYVFESESPDDLEKGIFWYLQHSDKKRMNAQVKDKGYEISMENYLKQFDKILYAKFCLNLFPKAE